MNSPVEIAPTGGSDRNLSLRKAIRILRLFTHAAPEKSLSELVQEAGYPRTVCYRMLSTLQEEGFVERNSQTGRYRLGLDLFSLGSTAIANTNLHMAATPVMRALSQQTNDTVLLVVEHNLEALCIEKVDGDFPVLANVMTIGRTLPLHCGAAPFVLLANMRAEQQEQILRGPLVARTPVTIIEPEKIRSRIAAVAANGYAIGDEDVAEYVIAVGVPLFGAGRRLAGALSVGGLKQRYGTDHLAKVISLTLAAAKKISMRLGAEQT
ncbi:IclR family transcriptional regulator [Bradyrhizobium lablabi]|uniref:IclR family transcriptional regulator n=1 Tax=Bradyrhizobium lablabi TaxID=722472 RepID=UPI00090B3E75|nr:IclR family transcriptional regulator [Bradyrhizobium lablabi]SHM82028.1 transcriptional regulator, IclR family [Bradyrhizobium lablabi]